MLKALSADWDEETGLWFAEDGKVRDGRSHVIRASAGNLLTAGLLGGLDRVPVERVLTMLRRAQQKAGAQRGNFRWRWEDAGVKDSNAAFFTILPLLGLRAEFGQQLTPRSHRLLDTLFRDARRWFRRRVYPIRDEKLRYPNSYLGDAVCLWLIDESLGPPPAARAPDMARILAYYLESPWGWGEHLSDLYVKVCQHELLALLMWGRELTAPVRALAARLLRDTARIDRLFEGGPRVPAIRSYMMDRSPRTPASWPAVFKPYRSLVAEDAPPAAAAIIMPPFVRRHRLEHLLEAKRRGSRSVDVACYGGARALAWVDRRWRLGAMSRYPLACDGNQPEWGLHWQSMPVAFWHRAGDWGYLQWMTEEDGVTRALPALARHERPSCVLSDRDPGARVGETFGIRCGSRFLVLRRMPRAAAGWPWVVDRLRLVDATVRAPRAGRCGPWHRLLLPFGEETLTVGFMPLTGRPAVTLQRTGGELTWAARRLLRTRRESAYAGLWFFAMEGEAAALPRLDGPATRLEVRLADGSGAVLSPWADGPWEPC